MSVNIGNRYGFVEVSYLTGQGRAEGDLFFEITRQTISNSNSVITRDGSTPILLNLNAYQQTPPSARLNIDFNQVAGRSASFTTLLFDPNRLLVEDAQGQRVVEPAGFPSNLPYALPARIRAFPGRNTLVQLRVTGQDAVFGLVDDDNNPDTPLVYQFDAELFREINSPSNPGDPDGDGVLASRLSDFVRFPLANVSAELRPLLRDAEGNPLADTSSPDYRASYVYFSGDNVALSNDSSGISSIFEELSDTGTSSEGGGTFQPDLTIGNWSSGSSSGTGGPNFNVQGTYNLNQPTPAGASPDVPSSLVSVYGTFRDYDKVMTGGTLKKATGFEIIMFPNSSDTYTFDGSTGAGRLGDLVAIRTVGGVITNIYYGSVDLGDRTFQLYPISSLGLDPTVVTGGISGTVSNLRNSTGVNTGTNSAVRKFTYTFGGAAELPTGFSATGTATVFRQ